MSPTRTTTIFFFSVFLLTTSSTFGAFGDCLWGGGNESTAYTPPYYPGMGGVTLANAPSPPMNLGAPDSGIPIQGTPTTQPLVVQQANIPTIPTITVPTGPVGAVGQPATSPVATATLPNLPPGSELMYILPPKEIPAEQCSPPGTPAVAVQVVSPTTPGAIPVAVRSMTVTRPKIDYEWTYAPITETTETLVKVVDPRTGKTLRTYCETDERRSTLPWPHRKEVVSYEQVTVQIATPLSPDALQRISPTPQPNPVAPTVQRVGRPFSSGELTTTILVE